MKPILLVLSFLVLAMAPLRAEEGDEQPTPAEELFEQGYWSETGSGALDAALDLYTRAVAAEGPPAIRARALYRSAVVLQRIGKTEQAIAALERLQRDFPAESDLLREARARLEEWTAVDLRTSFAEWYERYQYSPEFQARVLDLFRQLVASTEQAERQRAEAELLLIGDAALPVLRQHLESPSDTARWWAVLTMLKLGHLPDAEDLVRLGSIRQMVWEAWTPLLTAPKEVRERMLETVRTSEGADPLLALALQGPLGVLRALPEIATEGSGPWSSLLWASLAVASWEEARSLVDVVLRSPEIPLQARATILRRVLDRFESQVALDDLMAWVPDAFSTQRYLERIRVTPDSWRRIADAMRVAVDRGNHLLGGELYVTLVRHLAAAPSNVDLTAIAQMVARVPSIIVANPVYEGTARRLWVEIARATSNAILAKNALEQWAKGSGSVETSARMLLNLAREAENPVTREAAALVLGRTVSDDTMDLVLDAVAHGPFGSQVIEGMRAAGPPTLTWTPDRLTLLLSGEAGPILGNIANEDVLPKLIEAALKNPGVVSPGEWEFLHRGSGAALIQAALLEGWPRWTGQHRLELLRSIPSSVLTYDPSLVALLDEVARTDPDPAMRRAAFEPLAQHRKASLAAFRGALDLTSDEGLREARKWLPSPQELAQGALLRPDREAYDALAGMRRMDDESMRRPYYAFFGGQRFAALDMVQDPSPAIRAEGIKALMASVRAADIPHFVAALRDTDASVRARAADAALQSLQKIKSVEDQKAYWRRVAAGMEPGPSEAPAPKEQPEPAGK